jgi:hypothetical protein
MKVRQRRVRAIELSLTPQQVILVWLRNALQAGTFEEAARHSPPYREAIANSVYRCVRNSMKGQPEALVERAVRQARREADLLYLLVVKVNAGILEPRGDVSPTIVRLHRQLLIEGRLNRSGLNRDSRRQQLDSPQEPAIDSASESL